MKSIFGLQEEYVNIASEMEAYFLESGEDEIPEHLHDRLVINRNEMAEKISRYKDLIDQWEGDIETLDKKIKSLILRKCSIGKSVERLKNYISDALELYGQPVLKKGVPTGSIRFTGLEFTVTKIRTKPIVIEDAATLPYDYRSFSIAAKNLTFEQFQTINELLFDKAFGIAFEADFEGSPKKKEIKQAIERGENVQGARIDNEASYLKFS